MVTDILNSKIGWVWKMISLSSQAESAELDLRYPMETLFLAPVWSDLIGGSSVSL